MPSYKPLILGPIPNKRVAKFTDETIHSHPSYSDVLAPTCAYFAPPYGSYLASSQRQITSGMMQTSKYIRH